MDSKISIVVPVGPQKAYRKYLAGCLSSIDSQMEYGDQIILVDDMSHLSSDDFSYPIIHNSWNLGCAASWNIGIAESENEAVIMMGSDDKLLPGCLEACRKVLASPKYDIRGYYNIPTVTSEGEESKAHNNAAMVSKTLWNLTGGFPISAGAGAPDSVFISIMIKHLPQHLRQINDGTPLYWVRVHPDQDGKRQMGNLFGAVHIIRDVETRRWKSPDWTT